MGGDLIGGELKAWRKILKVSEGLAPKEKEKKGERKKIKKNRGLRGEVGKVFKEKQRERKKGGILRKNKRGIFGLPW